MYLLQPAPTLYLAGPARSTPLALLQFVLGLLVIIPATTLLDGPRLPVLAATVAGAALACVLAIGCWRLGLRRYTGATS